MHNYRYSSALFFQHWRFSIFLWYMYIALNTTIPCHSEIHVYAQCVDPDLQTIICLSFQMGFKGKRLKMMFLTTSVKPRTRKPLVWLLVNHLKGLSLSLKSGLVKPSIHINFYLLLGCHISKLISHVMTSQCCIEVNIKWRPLTRWRPGA